MHTVKTIITSKKFNIVWSVCALLAMWGAWLIAAACVKNEWLLPDFSDTVREFFALFDKKFFWRALANTLLRTLIAFLISFALALLCACLAAVFKPFGAFMRPIIAVLRTLPTMAVLLLILTWLTPRSAPVLVALLVLFPMCYSQLTEGIAGVSGELLQMAKVYKLSPAKKLVFIYLPHVAPQTLSQTGGNLSFGIKLIVSAEVMASTYTAIGGLMVEAQAFINLPRLAALTVCAVVFGLLSEYAFRGLAYLIFRRIGGVEYA